MLNALKTRRARRAVHARLAPVVVAAAAAGAWPLCANAQLLGPVDGGAETNPTIWFSGSSPPGSHTILNTTDVHSGVQSPLPQQ